MSMFEAEALPGKCLCGAVTFTAVPVVREMTSCHCSICRKWSGGAFLAVMCDNLKIDNEDALGKYESSEHGERLFCKTCGSNMFWRFKDGSANIVCIQAFDDPSAFEFTTEIFVDEKPANYSFAEETHKLTGAEFKAAIAGDDA